MIIHGAMSTWASIALKIRHLFFINQNAFLISTRLEIHCCIEYVIIPTVGLSHQAKPPICTMGY